MFIMRTQNKIMLLNPTAKKVQTNVDRSREEHVPAMLRENPVVLAPISLVFEK